MPDSRPDSGQIAIKVDNVEFEGDSPLPDEAREQFVREIQTENLVILRDEPDETWVNQAVNRVREGLQDRGYFKSVVDGTPYLVGADASQRHYVLRISIESGPQFKLKDIRITNSTLFSAEELRKQFSLAPGELFDVAKVREGLQAVSKMYGSKGYIDATVEPTFSIDEKKGLIDIELKVSKGAQYHIRGIEIFGAPDTVEDLLKTKFPPGLIFDMESLEGELEEMREGSRLDSAPEQSVQITRSQEDAIVDIRVDFRSCPEINAKNSD